MQILRVPPSLSLQLVFDENARLEKNLLDTRAEAERLSTENKELHLKMDLIMEENNRLKSLLLGYQTREEALRRLSGEYEAAPVAKAQNGLAAASPPPHQPQSRPAAVAVAPSLAAVAAAPKKLLQLRGEEELKRVSELRPFPFPDGK